MFIEVTYSGHDTVGMSLLNSDFIIKITPCTRGTRIFYSDINAVTYIDVNESYTDIKAKLREQ